MNYILTRDELLWELEEKVLEFENLNPLLLLELWLLSLFEDEWNPAILKIKVICFSRKESILNCSMIKEQHFIYKRVLVKIRVKD